MRHDHKTRSEVQLRTPICAGHRSGQLANEGCELQELAGAEWRIDVGGHAAGQATRPVRVPVVGVRVRVEHVDQPHRRREQRPAHALGGVVVAVRWGRWVAGRVELRKLGLRGRRELPLSDPACCLAADLLSHPVGFAATDNVVHGSGWRVGQAFCCKDKSTSMIGCLDSVRSSPPRNPEW
jgi:hypothetical protein